MLYINNIEATETIYSKAHCTWLRQLRDIQSVQWDAAAHNAAAISDTT